SGQNFATRIVVNCGGAWAENQEVISIDHLSSHISELSRENHQFPKQSDTASHGADTTQLNNKLKFAKTIIANLKSNTPSGRGLRDIQSLYEIEFIQDALTISHGNVTKAAQRLGISPQLLNYKLKKYFIDRKKI
ncbi:MAG: hypothetical protein HQK55_12465, partial [Deltaproteobacteria bacterium]|nr:hypothetical protein [Deltaproteobacteria bacterium]